MGAATPVLVTIELEDQIWWNVHPSGGGGCMSPTYLGIDIP